MPRAVELLDQGRTDELWQMCCGFTSLSLPQFMAIQKRLLLEQIELLGHSPLGRRLMQGARPDSVEDFRRLVPLTTYKDYCPELVEKREDVLPVKPAQWVHSSGRSAEYPFKWVPVTPEFSQVMGQVMYGVGIMSGCKERGDVRHLNRHPRTVYGVAPRPYVSGAMASMIKDQIPARYMPPLEMAEDLTFEERVKMGFEQALSQGFDYFFGTSLVLVMVGNKFAEASQGVRLRPLLRRPRALMRLGRGMVRSKLAHRPMLPRDIWSLRGIMTGGLESGVYKERIKQLWGRYPLDLYASTEGGIIATQTWDYEGMTFVPNLNFLEFITAPERSRWESDNTYQPKTVLLDEVKAGETYEVVVTNFHGGIMTRYRIGDMVKITALRNEKLGIELPQMAFERRTDDLLDFKVVVLTEKIIWEAIEATGIAYEDWTAYKIPGEPVLHMLVELKDGHYAREADVAAAIYKRVTDPTKSREVTSGAAYDWRSAIDFKVDVTLLPRGTFAGYTAQRRAEGADLAHLKPPHINPSEKLLAQLLARPAAAPAAAPATTEKVPA